jgi:hypothetical protein
VRIPRPLITVIIVFGACLYGGADQYLGSRNGLGEWTVSVSQMSAPWLAIAFLAGTWPERRIRAVALGALVTIAAVAGYLVMTLSPLEGVASSSVHWALEIRSQFHVILPGLITGPAFGWLGAYWRSTQSRGPGVLISALFVLEPFARFCDGRLVDSRSLVWPAEIALGLALAFVLLRSGRRPTADPAR